MPRPVDHPNEPGKWTLLKQAEGLALWRRERSDPMPVTMFYLLAPPEQAELIYDENQARAQFALASKPAAATRAA